MSAATTSRGPFDAALAGGRSTLLFGDGSAVELDVARWCVAGGEDAWLLDRCAGPTVDLGCGPGRLVTALAGRGVAALGVDTSAVAALHCRRRHVTMLCRDLFAPLPDEGTWSHVLLADGNIGIGGEPVRLLARAIRLLAPGGTVLVEADTRAELYWQGRVRVCSDGRVGESLPWAVVGIDVLAGLGAALGLVTTARHTGDRAFLELTRT